MKRQYEEAQLYKLTVFLVIDDGAAEARALPEGTLLLHERGMFIEVTIAREVPEKVITRAQAVADRDILVPYYPVQTKGGQATKELHGVKHYSEMGKKSAAARARKRKKVDSP